jgi:WD40 repeat protein
VVVWDLEPGGGIQTLRGLAAQVAKVCYSPDGSRVAALAYDWRVAVWDVGGRLRHVWEAPRGLLADNAGLAFSPDGGRFACSAGGGARLWEVDSGKVLRSWTNLPPSLLDTLAFHPEGKLLLFRMETRGGKAAPYNTSWREHPRVCRLRDLLGKKPEEPIKEIEAFNRHVFETVAASDGSYFVAEGLGGPDGKDRSVRAFAWATGREAWSYQVRPFYEITSSLALDPAGKVLAFRPQEGEKVSLVEIPSGKFVGSWESMPFTLGPGARHWGKKNDRPPFGFSFYRAAEQHPLVVLAIDEPVTSYPSAFSPDGSHLAWGNADGTVNVCDIPEVQRRLAAVGLGWR